MRSPCTTTKSSLCSPQLEIIILSEVRQKEKDKYDITYMWNLKYGTNELIYKTETDSQRSDLWLPRGERGRERDGLGVWGW